MAKSFREAFQGVEEELEIKLDTRYVLLRMLQDRSVIDSRHRIALGVIMHVV